MKTSVLKFSLLALSVCLMVKGAEVEAAVDSESSLVSGESVQLTLTLDEAKRIALEKSPTLAAAKASIESAMAQVAQSKSTFWPTVSVNGKGTRMRDNVMKRPDGRFDSYTNYSFGLSAQYTLFEGFRGKLNRMIAQLGEDTAIASCEDAKRLLLRAVAQAYYIALLQSDKMTIAKEDAEFNRMLLKDAESRFQEGAAKQSEVLNFELQVGNAEVSYVEAEQTWQNALISLGNLLAMSEDNIWEKVVLVPPSEEGLTEEIQLSEMLNKAIENRQDLRKLEEQISVARYAIESAYSSCYPEVRLFADYGFAREDKLEFSRHFDRQIDFGVSLNWELFSGFKTMNYVEQAKAELRGAMERRDELLLSIEAEIRQNYQTVISNRKELILQDRNLEIAKKIRDLVHSEYLGGTATITRLNEAQTDVTINASSRSVAFIQALNSLDALMSSAAINLVPAEEK